MPISDEDAVLIKPWLLKRSQALTDAEPDVLAEYIIALLKNKVENEESVKLLSSQLEDFVESSESFAREIVECVQKRSFANTETDKLAADAIEQKKQERQATIELTNLYKPDFTTYLRAHPDARKRNANRGGAKGQASGRPPQNTNKQTLLNMISTQEERTNKLIVANIPEDKLQEPIIRSYFQRFGDLVNVEINFASRVAELEFSEHSAATKAWASPTPIFDNRFIKVFFKKVNAPSGSEDNDKASTVPDEPFDVEKFKLQQEEKQRQWEKKQEEKAKYQEKLRQMIQLKEKMLANFEKSLGELEEELKENPDRAVEIQAKYDRIISDMEADGVTPTKIAQDKERLEGNPRNHSRGRGSYRGRGGIARGAAHAPYSRPPTARSLDLRTRTVLVKNFADVQNEKFQGHLKIIGEENIEDLSQKGDDISITFKYRFVAEKFMNNNIQLKDDGTALSLEWDESARPSLGSNTGSTTVDRDGDVEI